MSKDVTITCRTAQFKDIKDKQLLSLIRRYLQSGILLDGLTSKRTEGTPQGSPLSPLLSNIILNELDKELHSRNHRFVRYADELFTKDLDLFVFMSSPLPLEIPT